MLRTVIWYVSHATAGYLFGRLLNSSIAHYQHWKAKKRFVEALTVVMQEDQFEN